MDHRPAEEMTVGKVAAFVQIILCWLYRGRRRLDRRPPRREMGGGGAGSAHPGRGSSMNLHARRQGPAIGERDARSASLRRSDGRGPDGPIDDARIGATMIVVLAPRPTRRFVRPRAGLFFPGNTHAGGA